MLDFGYFPWVTRHTFMSGIWWHIVLISNVRYQKKRNESENKLTFQNLVLFKMIGTQSSKSWFVLSNISYYLYQFEHFCSRETRRSGTPHLNKRYVTKPQTSRNNMQKTRPRYFNLERLNWGSVFACKKSIRCIVFSNTRLDLPPQRTFILHILCTCLPASPIIQSRQWMVIASLFYSIQFVFKPRWYNI